MTTSYGIYTGPSPAGNINPGGLEQPAWSAYNPYFTGATSNPYNVYVPFSVDQTPTSLGNSSGIPGALGGNLPPPDISGYTYGDYATPNYNVPYGSPVPNAVVTQLNPSNPSQVQQSHISKGFIILGLVGLVAVGVFFDRASKKRKKK